jgi:hypothetical protein
MTTLVEIRKDEFNRDERGRFAAVDTLGRGGPPLQHGVMVREEHPQKQIRVNGVKFHVDEGIAPLVKELNRKGFTTTFSCQGDEEMGRGYISFADRRLSASERAEINKIMGLKDVPEFKYRTGVTEEPPLPFWEHWAASRAGIWAIRFPPIDTSFSKALKLPDGSWVRLRSGMRAGEQEVGAYRQGENIGFLTMHDPVAGKRLVNYTEVKPSYRRKGVGNAMWRRAQRAGLRPQHDWGHQSTEGKAWALTTPEN